MPYCGYSWQGVNNINIVGTEIIITYWHTDFDITSKILMCRAVLTSILKNFNKWCRFKNGRITITYEWHQYHDCDADNEQYPTAACAIRVDTYNISSYCKKCTKIKG